MIKQAVIGAGGQGSRMSDFTPGIPKALNIVGSKSLLTHTIRCLSQNGIRKIHLLLGVHAEQIINTIPTLGASHGMEITYSVESHPLGTGGSLLNALSELDSEFIFLYGDLYIDTNLAKLSETLEEENVDFVQLVHPTNHAFDSDLLVLNQEGQILNYILKPHPSNLMFNNIANSGIYGFKKLSLSKSQALHFQGKLDLDKDLLPMLLKMGARGKAVRNLGYVRDAGTPVRLQSINADFVSGNFNKKNPPAIFLDRDGTLNRSNGHISQPSGLHVYPDVGPFIATANTLGYRVFLITNQPVIARGEASIEDLARVHAKLEAEVALSGGYFDEIFYCPHHPHSGYPGERIELKIDCQCRKPRIGMILSAIDKFCIDTQHSIYFGDSDIDEECAKNANIRFIRVARDSTLTGKTVHSFSQVNLFKGGVVRII
jgi:mannose-1-phosphate guanylyltransferase / phosphomannomutase